MENIEKDKEMWESFINSHPEDERAAVREQDRFDWNIKARFRMYVKEKKATDKELHRTLHIDRRAYYDSIGTQYVLSFRENGNSDALRRVLDETCIYEWLYNAVCGEYELASFDLTNPALAPFSAADFAAVLGHRCFIDHQPALVIALEKTDVATRIPILRTWNEPLVRAVFCNAFLYNVAMVLVQCVVLIVMGLKWTWRYEYAVAVLVALVVLRPLFWFRVAFYFCTSADYLLRFNGLFYSEPVMLYRNNHVLTYAESKSRLRSVAALP